LGISQADGISSARASPRTSAARLIGARSLEKKLPERVKQCQQQYPGAEIQLWAMDEHRVGLNPIVRRIWVPWWETPIAKVQWRYEWVWVYGFVHPASGETYWWLLPKVNIEVFNRVLADFAQHFG
jgi:hypothetical protein